LQKNAQIKGFRPGKAPRKFVEGMYGERVKADSIQYLFEQSLDKAAREHSLRVVSLDDIHMHEGHDHDGAKIDGVQVEALVSIFPEPKISHYTGLTAEAKIRAVTDEEVQKIVDEQIENMRRSKSTSTPRNEGEVSIDGDSVFFNYIAISSDEKVLKDGPGAIVVGKGAWPAPTDEKLLGVKNGDTVTLELSFPESFYVKELRSQTASVTFTVTEVRQIILPEVTDEFVQSLGEGDTVQEVRKKLETSIRKDVDDENLGEKRMAILDAIATANPFAVPARIIDQVAREMLGAILQAPREKLDELDLSIFPGIQDMALTRAKRDIILLQLEKEFAFEISEEEVSAKIEEYSKDRPEIEKKIQEYYSKPEARKNLKDSLLREKVLDVITQKNVITEKPKETESAEA